MQINLGLEQFGLVQNDPHPLFDNMQKIVVFAPIDVMKMLTWCKVQTM